MKQSISGSIALVSGLVLGVAATAFVLKEHPELMTSGTNFSRGYQAVLLTNGAAYYGKVVGSDSRFMELEDVHYIGRQQQQDSDQPRLVLVKRGKELHSPERMYVKLDQVVFVEPVTDGSQVAKAIDDGKKDVPAAPGQ